MYTGAAATKNVVYLHMDIKIFTSQPMAILIWKIRRFPCIRLGLHLAESKTGIEQA